MLYWNTMARQRSPARRRSALTKKRANGIRQNKGIAHHVTRSWVYCLCSLHHLTSKILEGFCSVSSVEFMLM
ncbi:hypothetical protein GN956_G8910 [Arapaima gigas]